MEHDDGSMLVHAAAEGDNALRREQDDAALVIRQAEDEHLALEARDAPLAEV